RIDIFHDVDNARVVVLVELPGVDKDSISITLVGDSLVVAGNRRHPCIRNRRTNYALRELRFGRFMRTLRVAADIKAGQVSASLDSGMLTITWPAPRARSCP
ncbi:hypothetical protein PLICRDRAFT_69323, partial [Plicaturopsis crispa FD-325 SS-3]